MLSLISLLGLSVLPRVSAGAEVTHDLGLDEGLRGTIVLGIDAEVLRGDGWHLDLWTQTQSFIRSNVSSESPVRISPQQIHYPVGARIRFPLSGEQEWGLFAFHQSNHDIDSDNAILNRETLAYEIYGAEWLMPHLHVSGGLYYDRGTDLEGTPQLLPFQYYLFGATVVGDLDLHGPWYAAGRLNVVVHRNEDHPPAYVNLDGHFDAGARWRGVTGTLRTFLRVQRIEDYRFQGDDPRYLLSLGVGIGNLP